MSDYTDYEKSLIEEITDPIRVWITQDDYAFKTGQFLGKLSDTWRQYDRVILYDAICAILHENIHLNDEAYERIYDPICNILCYITGWDTPSFWGDYSWVPSRDLPYYKGPYFRKTQ